jgi:hypothetical protein
MTASWRGNGTGNSGITYDSAGVSFNATGEGIGAVFDISAPAILENAVIEMVVNVSSEFKSSGADLQPFAQIKGGDWDGEWDCRVENEALTAATDYTLTCQIDHASDLFNQSALDVQVGVQADDGTPAGVVTIKSAKVTLAAQGSSSTSSNQSSSVSSTPSNQISIAVNTLTGWSTDSTPATLALAVDGGITITPDWSVDTNKAMFILDQPIDLTGATVTYVVSVPQSYITDGNMVIQPFSQQNSGEYEGIFDGKITGGWNPASGLTAGDNTIVHGPFTAPPANIQRIGLQLLKQTKADGVTGDVIIRSITVNLAN